MIRIENVVRTYRAGEAEVRALRGVSLVVAEIEIDRPLPPRIFSPGELTW